MLLPRATIDHAALRHNLRRVRRFAPQSRVLVVVKANAYGHGLVPVAKTLEDADGFAVARLEEALTLREAGIAKPILVLAGVPSGADLIEAARRDCDLVVHRLGQIDLLEREKALSRRVRVWLKVDTGMHRLGILPEDVPAALGRLARCDALAQRPLLMTHLANADDPSDPLTARQCAALRGLAGPLAGGLSIGNSAGVIAFPESRSDWVRPGIMLYGSTPVRHRSAAELGLRPVMTVRARLIAVRPCRAGDPIGYGGAYVCPEDMTVGVAGIGYGDGYPRHAPSGTPVLVGDRRVSLIGRVSMDMITLDLRGVPDACVGDPVTLWGEGLSVDEVAAAAGTIGYELLCHMNPRTNVDKLAARDDGGGSARAADGA